MKIRIELDEGLEENEVVIRCRSLTDEVRQIQQAVSRTAASRQDFVLYQGEAEFYVPLDDILFFETGEGGIDAHTRDHVYRAKYRLYELEEILPGHFVRVSKSALINAGEVYSIRRSNLSTTSVAAFAGSHKQVFVSRHYAAALKDKIREMRIGG